jgi:tetratricopeptide (TPR) repeat protein
MSEWLRLAIAAIVGGILARLLSGWLTRKLSKTEHTVYDVALASGQKQQVSIPNHQGDNSDAAFQRVILGTLYGMRSQEPNPASIKELESLAQELEQQRQQSPLSRRTNILLGNVYRNLGQLSNAIAVLSQYIDNKARSNQRDVDLADALYNRACYFALSGDPTRALIDLRASIDLNPENEQYADKDPDLSSIRAAVS